MARNNPDDPKSIERKEVKCFGYYLLVFLRENPNYAKSLIDTLCHFFIIMACGLVLSVVVFGALAIQHYFQ